MKTPLLLMLVFLLLGLALYWGFEENSGLGQAGKGAPFQIDGAKIDDTMRERRPPEPPETGLMPRPRPAESAAAAKPAPTTRPAQDSELDENGAWDYGEMEPASAPRHPRAATAPRVPANPLKPRLGPEGKFDRL
jgi:hypothetical protein